jgi:hypothetical protein
VYVMRHGAEQGEKNAAQQQGGEGGNAQAAQGAAAIAAAAAVGAGAAAAGAAIAAAAGFAGGGLAAAAAAFALGGAAAAADPQQQMFQFINNMAAVKFRQVQLLDEPVAPTERTPKQLGTLTLNIINEQGQPRPAYIALAPVDPRTGCNIPLTYICRTNIMWLEVAAALVHMWPGLAAAGMVGGGVPGAAAAAAEGAAPPRLQLYLSAYNTKTQRVEFLQDKVMELYRFW